MLVGQFQFHLLPGSGFNVLFNILQTLPLTSTKHETNITRGSIQLLILQTSRCSGTKISVLVKVLIDRTENYFDEEIILAGLLSKSQVSDTLMTYHQFYWFLALLFHLSHFLQQSSFTFKTFHRTN